MPITDRFVEIVAAPAVAPGWVGTYLCSTDAAMQHFVDATDALIRAPHINSTVLMRGDVMVQHEYLPEEHEVEVGPDALNPDMMYLRPEDVRIRQLPFMGLALRTAIVRRLVPRNPFKDRILNQTCLVYTLDTAHAVVYIPHVDSVDEIPFYLPTVQAVAILYTANVVSVHYKPFDLAGFDASLEPTSRLMRIAWRLLTTAVKHSQGRATGYTKRVTHDVVVPKVAFQERYLKLKRKYAASLVENWAETTDPKKHVFEDLGIAAFLIELWARRYQDQPFEFRDLGCGNGLLTFLLVSEGYVGQGIDARARKLWPTYPPEVQACLHEQVLIPRVLLQQSRVYLVPAGSPGEYTSMSSADLLHLAMVCTASFPPNTFIIGNHADELTCWLPLLGHPFVAIPCCSHSLSGGRVRYRPTKGATFQGGSASSTYAALVGRVEELSKEVGWVPEREMLRIPSTRNAAVVGWTRVPATMSVEEVLARENHAEGWVENTMGLMKRGPRGH